MAAMLASRAGGDRRAFSRQRCRHDLRRRAFVLLWIAHQIFVDGDIAADAVANRVDDTPSGLQHVFQESVNAFDPRRRQAAVQEDLQLG